MYGSRSGVLRTGLKARVIPQHGDSSASEKQTAASPNSTANSDANPMKNSVVAPAADNSLLAHGGYSLQGGSAGCRFSNRATNNSNPGRFPAGLAAAHADTAAAVGGLAKATKRRDSAFSRHDAVELGELPAVNHLESGWQHSRIRPDGQIGDTTLTWRRPSAES